MRVLDVQVMEQYPAAVERRTTGIASNMMLMGGKKDRTSEIEPRGGALDAAWPRTPVAHLAFETDTHFSTIDCIAR